MPPKLNQRRRRRGANSRRSNAKAAARRVEGKYPSRIPHLGSGGTPPTVNVDLVYTAVVAVTTTTVQRQIWSGNGPYDPDVTSTGSQPYNYDDWATLYARYRVRASTIETNLRLNANGEGTMVLVPVNTAGAAFTTWQDASAAPLSQIREYFTGLDILLQSPNGSVKARHTTKQILGEDVGDRFQATFNASPTDEWFWYTHIESTAGAAIAGRLYVKITYHMTWFDRYPKTLDFAKKQLSLWQKKVDREDLKEKTDQKGVSAMDLEPDSPVMVNRPAGSGLPVITNSGTTISSVVLRPPSLRDVKVEKKTAR